MTLSQLNVAPLPHHNKPGLPRQSGASLVLLPAEGIQADLCKHRVVECSVLIKAYLNSFVLSKYSGKGKVQAHNLVSELLSINCCCWIDTIKGIGRGKK